MQTSYRELVRLMDRASIARLSGVLLISSIGKQNDIANNEMCYSHHHMHVQTLDVGKV